MIELDFKTHKPLRGQLYWEDAYLEKTRDVVKIEFSDVVDVIDDKYFEGYRLTYFIDENAILRAKPHKYANCSVSNETVEIPYKDFRVDYTGCVKVIDETGSNKLEINNGFIEHFLPENIERRKNMREFKQIVKTLAKKYNVSLDVGCNYDSQTVDVIISQSYRDKDGKYQSDTLSL